MLGSPGCQQGTSATSAVPGRMPFLRGTRRGRLSHMPGYTYIAAGRRQWQWHKI